LREFAYWSESVRFMKCWVMFPTADRPASFACGTV